MWYNVPLDTLVSDDNDTVSKARAGHSDTVSVCSDSKSFIGK